MQRVAVALVAAGLIGIVLSTLFTISGIDNLLTEFNETSDSFDEEGEVIWEGSSPTRFEGELLTEHIRRID